MLKKVPLFCAAFIGGMAFIVACNVDNEAEASWAANEQLICAVSDPADSDVSQDLTLKQDGVQMNCQEKGMSSIRTFSFRQIIANNWHLTRVPMATGAAQLYTFER